MVLCCLFFFFFKQKTAYEIRISDWSSDVCSSDLGRKERSQQVDDRDRQEAGDQQAGEKHRATVFRSEGAGLRRRPEAHGREFEELPPEQVAVDEEEGRSEERRVGKECVMNVRSRGSPNT